MFKKILDIFSKIITQVFFWFFLLCWNLLDSSNYELNLFLGNFAFSLILIAIFILLTNKISFSILLTLLIATLLNLATDLKAELLSSTLTLSDFDFLFNIHKLAGEGLIMSYMSKGFVIYSILSFLFISYVFFKTPLMLKCSNALLYIAIRVTMVMIAFIFSLTILSIIRDENHYTNQWLNETKLKQVSLCNKVYPSYGIERTLCDSIGSFADIALGIAEPLLKTIKFNQSSELIKREIANIKPQILQNNLPNIILVLNESIFDPSYLDYSFAQNFKFDFFNDKTFLKAKGILKVHTFGGGSSLSEFPSVTGIVHDVFKGPTSYPFINMAGLTNPSLFRELNTIGYYNIVIYPVDTRFINAKEAYTILGADKVVGIADYNYHPLDWKNVPEKFLSEMIDSEIQKAPSGKPVFVYVATMRNHGPHKNKLKNDRVGCEDTLPKATCGKLNDYILKLKLIDKDWMEYTNKIMSSNIKTVLINFGDHLPSFEGKMDALKFKYPDIKHKDIYRTFYNVRANYELNMDSYPVMDISYFPSLILDIIGGNKNEFYQASSFMRNKCNGLLLDCTSHEGLLESYKAFMTEQLNLNSMKEVL